MPFTLTDQVLVELIMLVLLLAAALVQLYRRNTQLEAEREWLLKQQATLQANRMKAIEERELMIGAYVQLVEDRRQARLERAQLDSALEAALDRIQDYEEQYGLPVSSHRENAGEWIDPRGNELKCMRVNPATDDRLS